jgi:hypothetical protein
MPDYIPPKNFGESDFCKVLEKWGLLQDKNELKNLFFLTFKSCKKSNTDNCIVINKSIKTYRKLLDHNHSKPSNRKFIENMIDDTPGFKQLEYNFILTIFNRFCEINKNKDNIQIALNTFLKDVELRRTLSWPILKNINIESMINKYYKVEINQKIPKSIFFIFAYLLFYDAENSDIIFDDLVDEFNDENRLSTFWISILANFKEMHVDSDDWNQLPHFVKTFKRLRRKKREENKIQFQEKIDSCLAELRTTHKKSIKLFEMSDLLSWSSELLEPSFYQKANDVFQNMIRNFNEYINLDRQHSNAKGIEHKRNLRVQIDNIETVLIGLYAEACEIISQAKAHEKTEKQDPITINNEELELSDSNATVVSDKLKRMTEKMNKLLIENMELETVISEKEKMLSIRDFEKSEILKTCEKAKTMLAAKSSKIDAISKLEELPKSLIEATGLIEAIFPEKIVFSEQAKKSAKESNFPVADAWPCLFKIATILHDLFFLEPDKAIDIEKEFNNNTRFELSMTEGKQTNKDPNLSKLRTIQYKGKEISIFPHVKLGNSSGKLLRVHFYPDRDENRIVVGHCGDHLDNYSTKSLK